MDSASNLIAALSQLISLDEATCREQIWPYLTNEHKTPRASSQYLETLLGSGPRQASFIASYLQHQFGSAALQPPVPAATTWGKPRSNPGVSRADADKAERARKLQEKLDKAKIERAFVGGGGKVLVKDRGEQGMDWLGGGKSARSAPAPPVAGPSVLPPPPATPAPPVDAVFPKTVVANSTSNYSATARTKLLEIKRALQRFDTTSQSSPPVECFCQAREHPLSPYTPLCTKCALVLCVANSPVLCPSCRAPLNTPDSINVSVAHLETLREDLIRSEDLRLQRLKEDEEQIRAAERFPELNDTDGRGVGVVATASRGYSNMVGGGFDLLNQKKIDANFGNQPFPGAGGGVAMSTLNGRRVAERDRGGDAKVIRLVGKKVKVVTKVKVVPKLAPVVPSAPIRKEQEAEVVEEGPTTYLDLDDDGVKSRSTSKRTIAATPSSSRPFSNMTLDEAARPLWTAEIEVEQAEEELALEVQTDRVIPGVAKSAVQSGTGASGSSGGKSKRPKVKKVDKSAPLAFV